MKNDLIQLEVDEDLPFPNDQSASLHHDLSHCDEDFHTLNLKKFMPIWM